MKKLVYTILTFLILIGITSFYYLNVDKNYYTLNVFNEFPIPNDAILEGENEIAKNYNWKPSSGTSIPFSYRLVIKKSGWKEVEVDGHGTTYENNGHQVNVTVAPDYLGIIKVN